MIRSGHVADVIFAINSRNVFDYFAAGRRTLPLVALFVQ